MGSVWVGLEGEFRREKTQVCRSTSKSRPKTRQLARECPESVIAAMRLEPIFAPIGRVRRENIGNI